MGSKYNFASLGEVSEQGVKIKNYAMDVQDDYSKLVGAVDPRITVHYSEMISDIDAAVKNIDLLLASNFSEWANSNYNALVNTDANTTAMSDGINGGNGNGSFNGGDSGSGSAGGTNTGDVNGDGFSGGAAGAGAAGAAVTTILSVSDTDDSTGTNGVSKVNLGTMEIGDAWNNLTESEQQVTKTILEQLGFTPEEIEQIMNGTYPVNPALVDEAMFGITNVFGIDPSVREYIISKYGFDIFNDDGTINREKLALLLAMDGKNPDDDFDIVGYLKAKYGTDIFNGIGGSGTANSASVSGVYGKSKVVASGAVGVGVSAGTISAGAIASALISSKNKENEDEDEEEKDDEEAEEKLVNEESAEGLNGKKKKKGDKKWLYGLGVGLGAAGMLASIDDDDDEEKESEEDGSDNFKA